ncbi:hypothetical protein C0581_02270 [Candidatus Parcubacteria bacterium]|nr:MAG: hypothetical protein C0581_02270 [Candidatus Parcubacteria bacterium]
MSDTFKKTIALYSKLGTEYLDDIEAFTPVDIQEFIDLLPENGKVLEIGCAGGRDAKVFIKQGFEYVGIDLVAKFIKEAKKRVPKGVFKKMDVLQLDFPKNYFDAVWANAVFLHLDKKDVPKALKNIYRMLKPGGKIHVRVKRGKGSVYTKDNLSKENKRLFTFFYKNELEKFIKDSSFKIISSKILPDDLGRNVEWASVWAEKK